MNRRSLGLLPVILGPLLGLAAAGPAAAGAAGAPLPARAISQARPAAAAPSAVAGFLHWNPGTDDTTTYSSTGGPVTVTQVRPGDDDVVFTGFGDSGGATVSTPVTNASCSVAFSHTHILGGRPRSLAASSDVEFLVQCYDSTGTQAEEPFDLLVTRPLTAPAGFLAYDYVYTGANGSLSSDPRFAPFQYNSSGKVNSVSHPGTGQYVVTMPGAGSAGNNQGTVKVSAFGTGAGNCQIGNWTATATAQKITVLCFSLAGAPQDRQFTVSYARANNLMGQNGLTSASASIRAGGTAPVYQPPVQFDSRTGAKITAIHLDHGQYVVLFGGSPPAGGGNGGDGHIQVTPVGAHYHHCGYIVAPTHTPELDVSCAGPDGLLADTAFTVQWVVG